MDYWNQSIGFEAFSVDETIPFDKGFAFLRSTISARQFREENVGAQTWSAVDPVSGQILSVKMDVSTTLPQKLRLQTLTHELGHALGLAHNFAASADPLFDSKLVSTSAMDYVLPQQENFGAANEFAVTLPYDKAALAWIYRGENPEINFAHCSDEQVLYMMGCDKFDRFQNQSAVGLEVATGFLETAKQDKSVLVKKFISNLALNDRKEIVRLKNESNPRWVELLLLTEFVSSSNISYGYKISAFSTNRDLAQSTRSAWIQVLDQSLAEANFEAADLGKDIFGMLKGLFVNLPFNGSTIDQFLKR